MKANRLNELMKGGDLWWLTFRMLLADGLIPPGFEKVKNMINGFDLIECLLITMIKTILKILH